MTKQSAQIVCELHKKTWLTEKEAAVHLGMGNHNMFKDWRENQGLPFYIPSGKKDSL